MIGETVLTWLAGRGISEQTARRFSLFSAKEFDGKRDLSAEAFWLGIPYFRDGKVVAVQYRDTRESTPKEKRWLWGSFKPQGHEGGRPAWNCDVIAFNPPNSNPIVITEGALDAMSAIEAGWDRAIAVPSASDVGVLEQDEEVLTDDGLEFILAPDCDAAGRGLCKKLLEKLRTPRCREFQFPEDCKDMNDILVNYGTREIQDRLDGADFFAVSGYYSNKTRPTYGGLKPVKLWAMGADLHKHVGFCTKQVSIWTGRPGNGKSTLLRACALALYHEAGWRSSLGFFEEKEALHDELVRLCSGGDLSAEGREQAQAVMDAAFQYIEPTVNDVLTKNWLMERADLAVRDGCKLIIADPWNYIQRDEDDNPREPDFIRITRWLQEIRRFADTRDVHFAIVAHPKRMEPGNRIPDGGDILGGSVFDAVTDLGISVQRSDLAEDWTTVKVWKSKSHRLMGPTGEFTLEFNLASNRFNGVDAFDVASAKADSDDVIDLQKKRQQRKWSAA